MGLGEGVELRLPFALEFSTTPPLPTHVGGNFGRDEKFGVGRPAVPGFGLGDFVVAEWFAVGAVRVLFGGRAKADVAVNDDERGFVGLFAGAFERAVECAQIVGVGDVLRTSRRL